MFIYVEFSDPIDDYCELQAASLSSGYERMAGGLTHRAQIPGLYFTTMDDYLNHDMLRHCYLGTTFSRVTLEFYKTADSGLTILYKLTDAMITSISTSAGIASVGINFGGYAGKPYDKPY